VSSLTVREAEAPYAGHVAASIREVRTARSNRRFAEPLYSVTEAAHLVGMAPSTLATWAVGYERRFPARRSVRQGPVITAVAPRHVHGPTIPFIGLVEAAVVQAFRRTGLSLQRIRKALEVLSQGDIEHALASRRIYTDGAQLLFDYATTEDDPQLRLLTVLGTGQRVFHEVIDHYLNRIEFDDAWATGLVVPVTDREILRVRPNVASGAPLFMNGGAPFSAVESRARAGESPSSIARDYDVPVDDILDALHALAPTTIAAEPPPVFFIDRGLGRHAVPNRIRDAGHDVVLMSDLYPDGADQYIDDDDEWIATSPGEVGLR
jgi:uncharacterized protein (DUF433 family)